jgi:hypothetical protein
MALGAILGPFDHHRPDLRLEDRAVILWRRGILSRHQFVKRSFRVIRDEASF